MTSPRILRLAVVSAGVSDPSSTGLLADRASERFAALAAESGDRVVVDRIELKSVLPELAGALGAQLLGPRLTAVAETLAAADAVVVATPVYKAGPSALLTGVLQVLDDDLLVGTPVLLAATAGTPRHALVIDDQLRGLFAYLRAATAPTGLFAAGDDWQDPSLAARIDRAARELLALARSGVREAMRGGAGYASRFGSAASGVEVDLDSDLMRLATGGGLPPTRG